MPKAARLFCPFIFVIGQEMKKIFLFILTIAAALLLTGCAPMPEYHGEVKRAKELYEKLDSARVTMNDNETGKQLMDFRFFINKRDEMLFSYNDLANGDMAYSDGLQFFYKTGDMDGWSAITPGNEEYIYNIYNRKYRYPYARGGLFFLDGASVSSAETTRDGNNVLVTYVYDSEKLNSGAVGMLDDVSSFLALTCVYRIDADGYITEFTEKGELTDNGGSSRTFDITYLVTEMNGINSIENPVDYVLSE